MRILGFEWDRVNRAKLESHDLDAESVEDLFEAGEPLVFGHPSNPRRWIALGFVPAGRFVLVVFEHDRETCWVRVVTAYEPTSEKWWKQYDRIRARRSAPTRRRKPRS
ncbi:MAG: BrnT family toxin [Deltaproteobacteria bacterium]|nr:BrnT family toxin [Deltaproteobacteria bacterium]MBI3178205.1 BrnT family toxin [Deltaproteobacteria bacterium]